MCSLVDDILEENKVEHFINSETCKKCQSQDTVIVLRNIDVYCKSCFLAATTHKFRAMLGKYRVVNPKDKVLIVYRVGHPSTALLHFLRSGLELSQHKRLRFTPIVLYIEENDISTQDRMQIIKKIAQEIYPYNFPAYFTSLIKFIDDMNQSPKYFELNEQNINEEIFITKSHLKKTSLTQFQDILEISKQKLMIAIAKLLDCRVVFTPDISIEVAVGMLSHISIGRGSQIPLNVGVCDDRDSEVKIFKPLRLFEMIELEYYNIFNNLQPTAIKSTESMPYASVQNLMKKFVEGLQVNYPSTIKTVTRTGDKLMCKKTDSVCDLCNAPIEDQCDLSSSEATAFSHWVSASDSSIEEFVYKKNSNTIFCFACSKVCW